MVCTPPVHLVLHQRVYYNSMQSRSILPHVMSSAQQSKPHHNSNLVNSPLQMQQLAQVVTSTCVYWCEPVNLRWFRSSVQDQCSPGYHTQDISPRWQIQYWQACYRRCSYKLLIWQPKLAGSFIFKDKWLQNYGKDVRWVNKSVGNRCWEKVVTDSSESYSWVLTQKKRTFESSPPVMKAGLTGLWARVRTGPWWASGKRGQNTNTAET